MNIIANGTPIERCRFYSLDYQCCVLHNTRCICDDYNPFEKNKATTKADKIRTMSDEELAELWWEHVDCGECPVHSECSLTEKDCKRLALDWLKQEVKKGE